MPGSGVGPWIFITNLSFFFFFFNPLALDNPGFRGLPGKYVGRSVECGHYWGFRLGRTLVDGWASRTEMGGRERGIRVLVHSLLPARNLRIDSVYKPPHLQSYSSRETTRADKAREAIHSNNTQKGTSCMTDKSCSILSSPALPQQQPAQSRDSPQHQYIHTARVHPLPLPPVTSGTPFARPRAPCPRLSIHHSPRRGSLASDPRPPILCLLHQPSPCPLPCSTQPAPPVGSGPSTRNLACIVIKRKNKNSHKQFAAASASCRASSKTGFDRRGVGGVVSETARVGSAH